MIAAVHTHHGRKIVALCDRTLIGKKFETNSIQLDLTSSFYKGKPIDERALLDLLQDTYTVNAVGKKSIAILIKNSIISKHQVATIKGIPYAYVVLKA